MKFKYRSNFQKKVNDQIKYKIHHILKNQYIKNNVTISLINFNINYMLR